MWTNPHITYGGPLMFISCYNLGMQVFLLVKIIKINHNTIVIKGIARAAVLWLPLLIALYSFSVITRHVKLMFQYVF